MELKKEIIAEKGRYYFKRDIVRYKGDPEALKKVLQEHMPPSFDKHMEQILEWCKSILRENGIPDSSHMFKTKSGEWTPIEPAMDEYRGSCWICLYVEKELGYDADSVPGLAARIISLIATIKANGATPLYGFNLGSLTERLGASLFWDNGRKAARSDELSKATLRVIENFLRVNGRLPKARELWEALASCSCIQEIDEDTIFWKRANGKEEKTTFKAFQNRLTKMKKHLK
ncbi:MAG: hypothetical protein C4519_18805 [Desulfobacteraceae bacterium]|nr:MAG: hypothetical protein C4519_18805 [Desulfobacteraceae bacterium]